MTDMITVRLLISGRVQGVGYRAWFAGEARRRGLAGWVRNRREGTVEARVRIAPAALDELLAAARRGPPLARVEDVAVSEMAGEDRPAGFEVLPTVE